MKPLTSPRPPSPVPLHWTVWWPVHSYSWSPDRCRCRRSSGCRGRTFGWRALPGRLQHGGHLRCPAHGHGVRCPAGWGCGWKQLKACCYDGGFCSWPAAGHPRSLWSGQCCPSGWTWEGEDREITYTVKSQALNIRDGVISQTAFVPVSVFFISRQVKLFLK